MTPIRVITAGLSILVLSGLAACGKDDIRTTCDEPQPYQAVIAGKRVVVPEGLDGLDKYKELSIPEAKTPPRPEGAVCVDYPPAL
jgi:uncharacterized lipoprotein